MGVVLKIKYQEIQSLNGSKIFWFLSEGEYLINLWQETKFSSLKIRYINNVGTKYLAKTMVDMDALAQMYDRKWIKHLTLPHQLVLLF